MSADSELLQRIGAILSSENDFLVTTHHGPDGDALGSLLAMGHLLDGLKKEFVLYNVDGVPESLKFLPGSDRIVDQLPDREFAWLVILDCSGPDRVDPDFASRLRFRKSIVLDHHLTQRPYGDLAYVDSDAAATGEIMHRLVKTIDWIPSRDFATNVYTALFTDTGSFQYANTNARVLHVASELAEWGADPARIAQEILSNDSMARVKMMRHVLSSMQFLASDQIAVTFIDQKSMDEAGAVKDDLEGLVNIPRSIKGVLIAAQIREQQQNQVYRVSLRSIPPVSVEAVASHFGGGGHRYAAGCTLHGSYDEICSQLFAALEKAVNS